MAARNVKKKTFEQSGMSANILIVCDSDSNIAFASNFALHARSRGARCTIAFCASELTLIRQAAHARVGGDDDLFMVTDWRRLFETPDILRFDTIFLMMTGKEIPRFCESLRKASLTYGLRRPRTIGGFIGEWISAEAQVIERTPVDYFVVNRADELNLFKTIASKFSFGCTFVHIPYPFVTRYSWAKPLTQSFTYRPDSKIIYAEQVQVPRTPEDRRLMFRNLVALAKRFPEREILFCEREITTGGTRHRSIGAIDDFFDNLAALAPNLKRLPGGFRRSLPTADLILSVSSTACVEALLNGVPAIFIKDFPSSGADKFVRSGLAVSMSDLFAEQEITISDEFYAEVGNRDAWDQLVALATPDEPRPESHAPVVSTLTIQYSQTITTREALFEAAGHLLPQDTAIVPQAIMNFSQFTDFTAALSPADHAAARFSDVVRVGAADSLPYRSNVDASGSYPINLSGTNFSIHFDVKRGAIRNAVVSGRARGRPFQILLAKNKIELEGISEHDLIAKYDEVEWSRGPTAVLRLRSFHAVEIDTCRLAKEKGAPNDGTLIVEKSFFPSDVHILARNAPKHDAIVEGEEDVCLLLAPIRWHAFAAETVLASITSQDGGRLMLAMRPDGSIECMIEAGGMYVARSFEWAEVNVIAIFATATVVTVIVNENVLVIDHPFKAARVQIGSGESDVEPCFDTIEAYRGTFSPGLINRVIELITLRIYDGDKKAGKHTEIPNFRDELEARLTGKPLPTAPAAEAPTDKAKPNPDQKAKAPAASNADQKPKAPAKPAADQQDKAQPSKSAAPKAPAANAPPQPKKDPVPPASAKPKPALAAAAPAAPNKTAPAGQLSVNVPSKREDPKGTPAPAQYRPTPILLSESAFAAGDFDEVLRISLEALSRTPDSTRHMGMVVRAQEKLNNFKEALQWAEQIMLRLPTEANGEQVKRLKQLVK